MSCCAVVIGKDITIAPVTFAEPFEVQELSETDRGTGGFGSTGR
jgi:dUTPase